MTMNMTMTMTMQAHSLPQSALRRLNKNDKALLNTSKWVKKSEFRLEDKVSLAHSKAVFLQGLVVFVGEVHFDEGTWVGIHLTGPSIGKGDCNGTFKGQKYFANVGKNNGILAPLSKVTKRNEKSSEQQKRDVTEEARMNAMAMVDVLTDNRVAAILQESNEKEQKRSNYKEEIYIKRLKDTQLGKAIKGRGGEAIIPEEMVASASTLKFSGPGSVLHKCDLELAEGLEQTQQNFCLSDPTLPDNPITFASQAFLNMTGYNLSEILGRNCRFLQGKDTDKYHVDRVRKSIAEAADCHVCLLNYRKDGTPFYNRLFMTALRDTRGRIKNYLGVQCEVSAEVAAKINGDEKILFDAGMKRKGVTFSKRTSLDSQTPTEADDSFSEPTRSSSFGSSTDSYEHPGMDMEEALFRATRDDPWSPLTPEEQQMLQAAKMDPWTGYTSNKAKETLKSQTKSDDKPKENLKPPAKSDDKAKETLKTQTKSDNKANENLKSQSKSNDKPKVAHKSDDDMAMMRFL